MSRSAVIGQPPNTDRDYYIVRALLRLLHLDQDPAKGISFGPIPPGLSEKDTHGPRILAGCIVLLILSIFITGSRLLIRAFQQKLRWGWDDWAIVPAFVCYLSGSLERDRFG